MNKQSRRFGQSGFSLLEVLVTMLITAIGLMGFAAMMVQSMKNNSIAMQRSVATFYAHNILDCIRVNQSNKASYARVFTASAPAGTTIADTDLQLWLAALAAALPSGAGQITLSGNTVTIEIKWTENLNASDQASHTWKTVSTL